MINEQLLHPASIVVVGASNNVHKPGGAILRNLLNGGYTGTLLAVNPKETEVQGVKAYPDVNDIPAADLAILAIPAKLCPDAVDCLASRKGVKAFIILSAGFGEETHEGALLEQRILDTVNRHGAALIGPNCIGLLNTWHHSVFSQPIPQLHPQGVDLISSSGATAVFILESAVTKGLQFNSVWSVGNAKQIGVEDVLQYMDEHFNPATDSRIKLLYIENIGDPDRLLVPCLVAHQEGLPHCRHQGGMQRKRKPRRLVAHGSHSQQRLGRRSPVPQGRHRALLFARGTSPPWAASSPCPN